MEPSIELVGKRCPKGYVKNKKTGKCNKTKKNVSEIMHEEQPRLQPIPVDNISPNSIELLGKKCPKGYVKNKKTGKCNKTKKIDLSMKSLENKMEEMHIEKYEQPKIQPPKTMLHWDINENYIFGYSVYPSNMPKKYSKVYIFDLDYTLIKTKSGKKFPVNNEDWEFLYNNVTEKINSLENSVIGIVSNQKGLKTEEDKIKFTEKIENIRKMVNIDFVFASIEDNRYRKPMAGSFDIIKNHYEFSETAHKITYIGDAAGRNKDFSDTDYKYAINCKIGFLTPELFFGKPNKDKPKISYPKIEYLTKTKETEIMKMLDDAIKSHNKVLVLCIGFPASGKSYIRRKILEKYPEFVYTNNDDIRGKTTDNRLVKKLTTGYNYVIDDNTNMKSVDRVFRIEQFKSYYKIGIVFDYEMEVCFHLNYMRMYMYNGKLIPKIVYHTLNKKYDREVEKDGFDAVIKIDKLFNEMNHDDTIRYYF